MKKILTATLAAAIALAPASAITQGVITGQQTYVTGSKPDAEPGKYKVVKIKKAKAVHHKHSYKVAKTPHYAKHSYYRPEHHWQGHHHWFLPALLTVGLGLFRLWH